LKTGFKKCLKTETKKEGTEGRNHSRLLGHHEKIKHLHHQYTQKGKNKEQARRKPI
jgi:hypothetical protein